MLQLPTELPENVLLLRYEDFVDDTLFAIKKIAAFFGLPEEPDRWQKIVSETSRAAVEQQISKFSKFSQMNSKTQYHGRHISPYEGGFHATSVYWVATSARVISNLGMSS